VPRDNDPLLGRVLDGRYRILSVIDRGGMATVYEAHDLRLERDVAVKVMHDTLGDDPTFAKRFVQEARSAARISHPNVVSVTDQGADGGRLFIVMEQVRGTTLRQAVRDESPMRPERALALLEQVLMALEAAHAQGIMHRDIKPENVLISSSGQVKVADFGLARAFGADTQHTRTGGLVIGSVSYLAPEAIQQKHVDPRADVYAAGIVLFELLTGRKPHEGDGAIQVAWKHVHEDIPPPSEHTAQRIPDFVDALVLSSTARDPDRRPRDARVFLLFVRRARAALDAGVQHDSELAADFLPRALGVDTSSIDYVDDTPTVVTPLDEEHTTVIDHDAALAAVAAGAEHRSTAAAVTAAAARPPGPAPYTPPVGPRSGSGVPGPRTPPPSPPGGPSDRRPRRRRNRRGLVLFVAVLALVVLVAVAGWWLGMGRFTSTPGVLV
jgi:serine/threonine-protein kinase